MDNQSAFRDFNWDWLESILEWFSGKLSARLVICSHFLLSICNIYLFPVLVFGGGICL